MAAALLRHLRAVVGRDNVLTGIVDRQTYEYDAYLERSLPLATVFVRSTPEVAAVVGILARHAVPFVARGGGTNLSGGAIPLDDAVVIEMSRMNQILAVDLANKSVLVQPGIFNLDISTALSPLGYYYAPDPASQKACSLGGNIAENAGGPHCFKHGVTSNHVLAIEVVLPSGEVTWLGQKTRDPHGLDLAGAFVGSEGTLGIVTAALLRILRKPEAVKTLLAVCDSIEDGGQVVSAIVAAGLVPATLEMMDNRTINAIEDNMACGYPREAAAVLLIELDGLNDGLDRIAGDIVALCRQHGVEDVRVAQDEAERAALWKGRKGAFGAISRLAPNYLVSDGTVPRTRLPEALHRVEDIADRHGLQVASVFHAGDGNLHPLLLFDSRREDDRRRVMAAGMEVLEACVELGGTVSGEHGIGVEKLDAMSLVFKDAELRAQRHVKEAFDPRGLCNPGKVLPGGGRSSGQVSGARRPGGEGDLAGPARHDHLAERLIALLGSDHVVKPSDRAASASSAPIEVRPAGEEELSEVLALAGREGLKICVAGGGTKQEWGNRCRQFDLLLSTTSLRGFSHLEPDNLTLGAAAGMRIDEVRERAEAAGRCLPLDPRRPSVATVGGVCATGDQGACGAGYGGVRDMVLGLRAVLADGSRVSFGGRTVKNVTGYDMTKLFVGSFGVLGVITDVTFRLLPYPETQACLLLPVGSFEEGGQLAADILASHLEPLALQLMSQGFLSADHAVGADAALPDGTAGDRLHLLAAFAGHREAVRRSVREVRDRFGFSSVATLEAGETRAALDRLADGPAWLGKDYLGLRASVPTTEVWGLAERAAGMARQERLPLELSSGMARGTIDMWIGLPAALHEATGSSSAAPAEMLSRFVTGLRQDAGRSGGRVVVTKGLAALGAGFDAWGEPSRSISLMKAIKKLFDPGDLLNPGRFLGGI